MCETLETISRSHVGLMAMEVRVVGGAAGWQTLEAAIVGVGDERTERALYDDAWEGLPHDDVAAAAGHKRPRPDRFVGPRRALAPDEVWQRSAYRAHRARRGLHDFARALLPFEAEDGPRALVVQFDGLNPSWSPEPEIVRALSAIAPHLVDAFRHAFVLPIRHHQDLLDRLTDAQREVAPFLATAMTEGEIADALNRSRHTIHDHAKSIYRAWGVRNRAALRDLWNQHGPGEIVSAE
jgi:DNA-binding CsgD family transcriptional regulator